MGDFPLAKCMSDESIRPSFPEYFQMMAQLVARRSTCLRRHVGCVATKYQRVIATGYNGPVSGRPHCTHETCYRLTHNIPSGHELEKCWATHAEQNVVAQCARYGISLEGATIYVNYAPCITCTKILLAAGVDYCIYSEPYDGDKMVEDLWKDRLIRLKRTA